MPDNNGKLTAEERQKVEQWLGKFPDGLQAGCPLCASKKWILGEHLVQPIALGPNQSLNLSGIGYPHLMLISDPCGYTMFINAVVVGILPSGQG